MARRNVILNAVRIEGFRSCERVSFSPHRQLSVLIGPNGSGKTNILQAITLITTAASRYPRHRSGEITASKSRILAEFLVGKVNLTLRSTLSYALDEDNKEAVIDARDEWRLGRIAERENKEWTDIPSAFLLASSNLPYNLRIQGRQYRIMRSALPTTNKKRATDLEKYAKRAAEFLSRITYYSAAQFTNPLKCPSSIEIDEDGDLVGSGRSRREHQQFLFDLFRLSEGESTKYEAYKSLIGRKGLNLISDVHWKKVLVPSSVVEVRTGGKIVRRKRQRVLLVPSVTIGSDRISFSQLSEGTFKTIALIFYLVTDNSDLLLIEEPEVCVHHGLLASVIELIKAQSREKQIIFSTHSDFVLDQVDPENVFSVTRQNSGSTTIKSLASGYSQKRIEALREFLHTTGNLGEFWRQGGLDS